MIFWMVKKIIMGNKLRSAVPLMGIIIGVASIMGIFAISSGGEAAVKKDLASIAENRVLIGSSQGYDLEDLKLLENMPIVNYVFSPEMNMTVSYDEFNKIKVEGYTKSAIQGKELEIEGSSNIRGREVLIGDKTAQKMFNTSHAVGKIFQINLNSGKPVELRVIGVYREDIGNTLGIGSIYMDIDEYNNLGSSRSINTVVVTYKDKEDIEETTNYVIQILSRKNYRNRYTILEGNARYQKIEKIKDMINIFLGAVGIVALVMGGLGISNLLLNSVREMTPSIGILRTMGMSEKNILKIFLLESTVLSTIGGAIGIIFGCGGAYIVGKVIGIPSVYYVDQIVIVFVTSVGMGIVFGSLPAYKAAKLQPVEAMKI
ncbi:ABC transporter permease [Psychrilyobacter atlanticus]|uniref:ABC transporter permease n=1 Tax=Psychrilyobacter atlanticus TaxID=271091 RepID=UPI00041C424F|nr:ABC transporter permease [Psychrilyobacter atlanticus]